MHEFAIKKETLANGTVVLTPVTRRKTKLLPKSWERITKIEDKYCLQDLDWNPNLTYDECNQRIDGYKEFLRKKVENTVKSVTFDTMEEHKPTVIVDMHVAQ